MTMALSTLKLPSCNDVVLLVTLAYSALDIRSEWATFTTCRQPVHQWLLSSYSLLLALRLLHYFGSSPSMEGEFLVNLRLKGTVPQLMLYATWFIAMPLFVIWTVTGTFWTWEVWHHSPQCMPVQFLWFGLLWQLLSYIWIVAHLIIGFVALSREWKLRSVEADLRALEDPDTLERWGAVSQLQYESTVASRSSRLGSLGSVRLGLSPAEIGALGGIRLQPAEDPCAPHSCSEECSVCLTELRAGDSLRRLPNCVHCFHRSCIDLWLLRSATCPLCKVEVPRPTTDTCGSFWV